MGELPKFITNVPEESIQKSPVNPNPVREFFTNTINFSNTVNNVELVPKRKGYVFEVRNLAMSCISTVPAGVATFYIFSSLTLTGAGGNVIMVISLDHPEHQYGFNNFSPLSVIIREELLMKGAVTPGSGTCLAVVSGFYIRKEEIINKANILI